MTTIDCVSLSGAVLRLPPQVIDDPGTRELARDEAIEWIKRLRLVQYDGESMRQRFTYRDDSLWWFTEIYLHKMRQLDRAVQTLLALEHAVTAHAPARIIVTTTERTVREAAEAFAAAHGVSVEVTGTMAEAERHGWSGWLVGATADLSRLRPTRPPRLKRGTKVAAFVHTAFWRRSSNTGTAGNGAASASPSEESYIGPVLSALAGQVGVEDLTCVGVGPRRNFRARRWWDPVRAVGDGRPMITAIERLAPRSALASSRDLWRRRHALAESVVSGHDIRAAARVRGCDLWPILRRELQAAALVQWPWSARAMDEAGAAMDVLAPRVVLTYAEAGGWGRALMLEARRRGVPSVGLQHGFIYRHWLNYRHATDEMQHLDGTPGFPRPDRTLLFDGYAAEWLETSGHFPSSSLTVTGSPRLDDLASRVAQRSADREPARRHYGVAAGQSMALFAAKFTEVRSELPALAAALRDLPAVRLVIKAHPAELPDAYASSMQGLDNVVVAGPEEDLARLFIACDAIVTMNSTVAIDGLVLGIPSLVLGLPGNLSPFVAAGAMLGVEAGGSPRLALEALLYDRAARAALLSRGAEFAARYQMRTDGSAAGRAATHILGLTT